MPDPANIGSNPTLRQYAQAAAQEHTLDFADFLAPTVNVATTVGQYKEYDRKHAFRIPRTQRASGGRATEIGFEATDATYNCTPHALDFPVDALEELEGAELESVVQEGANMVAQVAGLSHEKDVITAALAAAGGAAKVWNAGADPIADIDAEILNVLKAAGGGTGNRCRVGFGAGAWELFRNHSKVRDKFIVGNPEAGNTQTPTIGAASNLFLGMPRVMTSYAVEDTAVEGKAASLDFLLNNVVLIFAASDSPTRRDPSFMKTFRLNGQWMVPGSYERDDGRVVVAKFDWSSQIKVTNSAAFKRLNVSAA